MSLIEPGKRPYVTSKNMYGEITRTNMLGLLSAPIMTMDDNTLVGFAGAPVKTDLVDPVTKKNLMDDEFDSLPLDVRDIGRAQLTAHGVSAETQTLMFSNFMTYLTQEQRDQYTAQWMGVNASGDAVQISSFIDAMVAALIAL